MPLLFIDYTNLVLKSYEEKREANRLSRLLMHPTTANIRQECLNVYNERFKKGEVEEDILRSFFGVPPAGRNFDYIIERHHADKFRPLRSIIKREIKNPSLVNVEMWAWLLDFTPRPLAYAQKVLGYTNQTPSGNLSSNAGEAQNEVMSERNDQADVDPVSSFENKIMLSKNDGAEMPVAETKNGNDLFIKKSNGNTNNNKIKIIAATGLLLAVLFAGIYSFLQYRRGGQTAFGKINMGCMYWAYDHYEEVPCDEGRKGRLFLPLEKEKINSFRMITRKDTITAWSVGKMYYIKDKNKIKYYTEPGNFPEDINRTLKKLSRNIFEKDSINRKTPD